MALPGDIPHPGVDLQAAHPERGQDERLTDGTRTYAQLNRLSILFQAAFSFLIGLRARTISAGMPFACITPLTSAFCLGLRALRMPTYRP